MKIVFSQGFILDNIENRGEKELFEKNDVKLNKWVFSFICISLKISK